MGCASDGVSLLWHTLNVLGPYCRMRVGVLGVVLCNHGMRLFKNGDSISLTAFRENDIINTNIQIKHGIGISSRRASQKLSSDPAIQKMIYRWLEYERCQLCRKMEESASAIWNWSTFTSTMHGKRSEISFPKKGGENNQKQHSREHLFRVSLIAVRPNS